MDFIAKIGAAIRAMLRKTHEWVKIGGRWIMRALPGGGVEPMPAAAPAPKPSAPDADVVAIKAIAGSLAGDLEPAPELLAKLSDRQAAWLKALDQRMLCRIACADVDQIRAHLRGTATIKGVLHGDKAAVDAYVTAQSIVPAGERTVEQELAARGIVL